MEPPKIPKNQSSDNAMSKSNSSIKLLLNILPATKRIKKLTPGKVQQYLQKHSLKVSESKITAALETGRVLGVLRCEESYLIPPDLVPPKKKRKKVQEHGDDSDRDFESDASIEACSDCEVDDEESLSSYRPPKKTRNDELTGKKKRKLKQDLYGTSMNKTLLLLLITIVESQSDGILSSSPIDSEAVEDGTDDYLVENGKEFESPHLRLFGGDFSDERLRKRSPLDPLTRRSVLDKNFMRFGRSGYYPPSNVPKPESDTFPIINRSPNSNFMRFGRGPDNNFMRFGRGQKDNFIRFGRGAKDNFIRFGRGNKDNFMRFGKSSKDNFIRFGKRDNYMQLGRDPLELDEDYHLPADSEESEDNEYFSRPLKSDKNFMRFGKRTKSTNFVRFGKSGNNNKADSFIRFGKSGRNGTNFLRFGRNDFDRKEPSEAVDDPGSDVDLGDLDLNGDKVKNGPIIRIKRSAKEGANEMEENPPTSKLRAENNKGNLQMVRKRSISNLDKLEKFPQRFFKTREIINPMLVSNSFKNTPNIIESSRPLRIFPQLASSGLSNFILSPSAVGAESKRDQSGSNFIRFG